MQTKVPKFIDIEDRVVGPLTWRQLLVLGIGASFGFLFYSQFNPVIGIPIGTLSIGLGISLAFVTVNGRPFKVFLGSVWHYLATPRRYFWKKELPRPIATIKKQVPTTPHSTAGKSLSPDQLRDMSAALDVHKRHRD